MPRLFCIHFVSPITHHLINVSRPIRHHCYITYLDSTHWSPVHVTHQCSKENVHLRPKGPLQIFSPSIEKLVIVTYTLGIGPDYIAIVPPVVVTVHSKKKKIQGKKLGW